MSHPAITQIESPGSVALTAKWRTVFVAFVVIGVLAFAGGLAADPVRAWHNYLVGYFVFLCWGLFGVFFAALNHAVNATWMIVVRRVAEGMSWFLPVAFMLFLLMLSGLKYIFPWAAGAQFVDPSKQHWLSLPYFAARHIVFFALWIFFSWKIVGLSLKQDATGDVLLSKKMIRWSIVFMAVFAGTFSLAAFDLMMSLQPHWNSTLFAVYCFAGLFQSGLALLTILFVALKRQGALAKVATPSHLKDLGTLVFAFTIFMTYIGFSQFMLIWYANLPEETVFFAARMQGGWEYLFLSLVVFKFAIPFFGLLSQTAKKNEKWLLAICAVVLIGEYVDIYWLTMPTVSESFVPFGWLEIGTLLGFIGLFGLVVARFFAKHPVLAARDPRILKSVNWRFWE
jgi:hypothetical protein